MAPCPDTPLRLRRQSGSTRHDDVIAVSEPQYWPRLPLGLARPRRRSPWKTLWRLKIASVHTGGLLSCRCSPASAPPKRAKLSARTTVLGAPRHRRALQIPIAADKLLPAVPCTPRFRAPALFGRLLLARVEGFVMQASENLHIAHKGTPVTLARQPIARPL